MAEVVERLSAGNSPEVAMLGSHRWTTPTPSARKSAKLANLIRRIAIRSSAGCRARRGRLFIERLQPSDTDKVLDLGGGRGGYMAEILSHRRNVTIADVDPDMLRTAAETYGFGTLHLDGAERFAISDQHYDLVFCSSVIEHVTGPKEIIFNLRDGAQFAASARAAQANFANEVRRVAKRYFVQTPYKYFPLESHSFLPFFVVLLPRRWQVKLLEVVGRF